MKCVFIISPGEVMEGKEELGKLGYEVEPYPSTPFTEGLSDSRVEEFTNFLGYHPDKRNSQFIRSLRMSFVNMLTDPKYAGDDYIIFGESDSCPIVGAGEVRKVVEELFRQHPDVDVIRPFKELSWGKSDPPSNEGHWQFSSYETGEKTGDCSYVWGTHALIIPVKKRAKIARIFSEYQLPVDTALEAANSNGEINMLVGNHNLFYQKPRTSSFDASLKFDDRQRNIAVCLSSYKRLDNLQRQIYCMMDQSYDKFHLFVAVKGVTEYIFNEILMPHCRPFIDAGRLTMRLFPNKNQLSNFVDTVRGLDISGYELFAKIDDDDFYDPDYLKTVNDFHSTIPAHHSSTIMGWRTVLSSPQGFPKINGGGVDKNGATMVMPAEVMDLLIKCEADPADIPELVPAAVKSGWVNFLGFAEDQLMYLAMNAVGRCNDIRPFLQLSKQTYHFVVQESNSSVMRGGFVSSLFKGLNTGLTKNDADRHEHVVAVKHPDWQDILTIVGDAGVRASCEHMADILTFNETELHVKWHEWGTERFVNNGRGVYELDETLSAADSV